MLSKFLYLFLFLTFVSTFSYGKKKPVSIENFKNSKNVFEGKVIAIQELKNTYTNDNDYYNVKLVIEFEVKIIYKGRRYEKFMIVEVTAIENKDYYEISNSYLVYVVKNRSKSDTHYSAIRSRNILSEEAKTESVEIQEYIKRKLFRRAKNPIPKFKIVSGGCNC